MKTRRKSSARGFLTAGSLREIHDRLKKIKAETPVDYACRVCDNRARAMPGEPVPECIQPCRFEGEFLTHGPMEAVYVFEFPLGPIERQNDPPADGWIQTIHMAPFEHPQKPKLWCHCLILVKGETIKADYWRAGLFLHPGGYEYAAELWRPDPEYWGELPPPQSSPRPR